MALLMLVEVVDPRLKTAADLERVTKLPVLATLGDLSEMTEEERRAWAFRAWTIIKGKITASQTHSLVCGVISARPGEGRSTWVNLLAQTAFDRGLRVVVAEPRASTEPPVHPHEMTSPQLTEASDSPAPNAIAIPVNSRENSGPRPQRFQNSRWRRPGNWAMATGRRWSIFLCPGGRGIWSAATSGATAWRNGKRSRTWFSLVELPAITCPEAVLLAENLPQLIWLARSGEVGTVETRKHLETLRHAGCNLVGAALNCERSWLREAVWALAGSLGRAGVGGDGGASARRQYE